MNYKILTLLGLLVITSCSTKKEILYFQGIERLENIDGQTRFEPVFEVNDIIKIDVSSLNSEVVVPFQKNVTGQSSSGSGGGNAAMLGYLVDINGDIQFPVLGKVPVAGMSRSELETYLTQRIREYVKDAVIAVRLLNFRVVVLGEAGSQTVVRVENESITMPELIATVGGIPYSGKRNNIMVIREIAGERTYGYVDMTSAEVFENPFYYLRQNDIVNVEPTYRQVKSAGWVTSPMGLVSLGTTILGFILLITR